MTNPFEDPAAPVSIDYDALRLMVESLGVETGVSRHYPKELMESKLGVADIVALLVAEHKRANTLEERLARLEELLDRMEPGWRHGGCLSDCKGACCDMG